VQSVRSANNRNTVPWGNARIIHRGMNKALLNQVLLPYSPGSTPATLSSGLVLVVSLGSAASAGLTDGMQSYSLVMLCPRLFMTVERPFME
jgi:hypothetical protein